MNRREFLKFLSIGAASVAAPKLIFDLGANLYKYQNTIDLAEFEWKYQIGEVSFHIDEMALLRSNLSKKLKDTVMANDQLLSRLFNPISS